MTIDALGIAKRSEARKACAMNLKTVAAGFDNYAADTNGNLLTLVMPTNKNWLHGNGETGAKNNAANLLPLVTGNYVQVKDFYAPGAGGPRGNRWRRVLNRDARDRLFVPQSVGSGEAGVGSWAGDDRAGG